MHFIIKHWHAVEDTDEGIESKQNSVVVEGYIVPNEGNYEFFLKNEKDNITKIDKGNTSGIGSLDTSSGTITIPIECIKEKSGELAEHFSGISISAGHSALDSEAKENSIKISYQKNVHLVKAHIFYTDEKITVYGSGQDDGVFGAGEKQEDAHQDTSWVYTYKTAVNGHNVGDVVTNGGEKKPVFYGENLPSGLTEENVQKTKVYNTIEGLHTDKTASVVDGSNREFNIDLESWYSGAPLADIGLVLDSSGSMGFTSDNLKAININELNLDEKEKKQLEAKELKSSDYQGDGKPSNADWENKIFLTEDDINLMLNPHNTDNSKLSASDYSYFIFDPRTSVNEYVPLGYWDGSVKGVKDKLIGYYEFNKGNYDKEEKAKRDWLKNSVTGETATLVKQIKTSQTNENNFSFIKENPPTDWTEYKGIKMADGKGFNIKNDSSYGENGVGILLDAKPTSNNFTISFSITKENEDSTSDSQNYVDILYVGNKENKAGDTYYRSLRDGKKSGSVNKGNGNSINRFKGYKSGNGESFNDIITNMNSVFSSKTASIITLVFKNGKVTSYLNGSETNDEKEEKDIDLSGNDIIFKGFDNGYDGADLYVDNIAVFDAALTADEVKNVENIIKSEDEKYIACNECFFDEFTEDSIGVVSKYFIGLDGGTPGWYYVNYDSELENEYFEEDIQSCKRYWGIPKNGTDNKEKEIIYTDKIHGDDDDSKDIDTGFTYKPEKSTPIEFYIDSSGYLRCFFTSSTKQETAHASYVYYKDDSDYVKTEALQRALGSFSTMLEDVSPESKISAVRFSSDKIKEEQLDKLVLLDWTDDPIEEQDIMSLNRGEGGTLEGTSSSPDSEDREAKSVEQFNYGLTGGTATLTGLKAFEKFLSNNTDESADKYLIIFTDGKDSTDKDKQEESKKIATELKEKGYTIFGVMLTGGSVEFSDKPESDYQQAKNFLLTLVGNSKTDANSEVKATSEKDEDSETVEDYFYSTVEADNSIDALTEIFTDQILTRITYNLYNYTVDDYIDPRFDLVSAENNIYNLNADGKITIKKQDSSTTEYDLKNGSTSDELKEDKGKKYLTITLSNDSKIEKSARNARLYYDDSKKMYFLKWVDQTIPGCIPNADYLSVWNAEFKIRAKDDFIGGNAVLTNGNEKNMNWVYNDEDTDKSSGVDDAILPKEETDTSEGETVVGDSKDKDDKYPSKGFPRVTVNVPPEKNTFSEEQLIYMGEKINKEELSEKLMQDTYNELKNTNLKYYIEYLSRYASKHSDKGSLEKYKKDLKEGKTVTIPYYYLPNSSNTTLTGTEAHEKDQLGILEYKVVPEGDNYSPKDGIIKDRNDRKLVFTVKYFPLKSTENIEYNEEESLKELTEQEKKPRKDNNETLVTETDYKWDESYKPAVGDEISKEDLVTGTHTTKDVSGEISLQLVLTPDIQEVIGDDELTYKIDLMREYDNKDKQKVGTFTATYKKENMPLTQPEEAPTTPSEAVPSAEEVKDNTYQLDEKGNLTILAKIDYIEDYMKTNGLPIGTYTLANPQIADFENLKFKLPNVITENSQYTSELFSLGSEHEKVPSYLATFKDNDKIILGDKDTSESTYTDLRFGLMRVTPITKFELPKTGKTSLIKICGVIGILTIFGFIILVKKRKDL